MNPTALITGASSGIGRALAEQFAARGYALVLVARHAETLRDVGRALSGSPGVNVIAADLSAPRSARALVDQLNAEKVQIDVLVNNAGFGMQGEFVDLPVDRQIDMIHLNVMTLTELMRLLLPGMLERRTGGVLNVASTAAFQAGPMMSVYYATKAYVLSVTEGVAEEVAGRGLNVSCLCPGPTETNFAGRAGMIGTNLFKGARMTAEDVAREGFEGWNRGETIVIPGWANRRGALLAKLAPRSMVRRAVKRLNSNAS
jgi:short-subunit dehydrogenase